MQLAHNEGRARMEHGESSDEFKEAQRNHEAYRKIVLNADEVNTGQTWGSLI